MPEFSLVVPCYNEARGLPELIRRCEFVAVEGRGEVILVDNGSTDASEAVLTELLGAPSQKAARGRVRWVRVEINQGYGFGITSGLSSAAGPIIGWTHADLQADPADVLRAIAAFGNGSARGMIVKGRRYGRPVADRIFTAGMSIFESVLLRAPLNDINAQPTMFDRRLLDTWGTAPTDFSLDLFALYQAHKSRFEVRRIPVIFVPRKWGSSSWNTDFTAKFRFIKRTVAFSLSLKRSL